jgi:hypothetical protein
LAAGSQQEPAVAASAALPQQTLVCMASLEAASTTVAVLVVVLGAGVTVAGRQQVGCVVMLSLLDGDDLSRDP